MVDETVVKLDFVMALLLGNFEAVLKDAMMAE
jgi:hypothetical protein